ncbi:MAG: anaerobic ribonucleoside-triphosphate reductase, partial [Candidatus Thermoplasmatota archaeon]
MIRKIKKRDGKIVDFNPVKISEAIWKAAQAVGGKDYKKAAELTDKVITILEKELKRGEIPTVEHVQDVVEKILIEDGHAKTAKAYILYRKQHQDMREIGGLLKDIDVVDDYLSMLDWKVNENSNMAYSLQGLNVYATESIISHYWLNKIYPPEIGEAHTNGSYHIHDLGTLGSYCVGWDLKDILLLGFRGVPGKVESKPAKHFSTALMQVVNYLYTLQGEAAGAQALSNFDSLLAPFIRYDQLKYADVKQEMQKFLFNMNVPTRVGFQSLAHDEPIILRKNGNVKVEFIGKFIEENFGENRTSIIRNVDGYGNPSDDSFALRPNEKFEVISFNDKGEVQWRPIKALIKHRIQVNGLKRIRTGAGEIKVSPAHSLFKSNDNKIKPVMAKELECAKSNSTLNGKNHILAVNSLKQNMLGNDEKIDLFDLIEELPEKIRKRIFIQAKDVAAIKEKIGELYGSLKEFLYKDGRTDKSTLYEGFRNNVVSFETYIKYSEKLRDDAKIYIKPYNKTLYERFLGKEKLENFVKLTAWFVSEGKASHAGIVISQEKSKSKDILAIANKLGITVSTKESKGYSTKTKSKTSTVVLNMKMSGLYPYVLPYLAGATSKEKTIPSFIFNLNKEYRNIFLGALFKGDGYLDEQSRRITYSSMSDKLLTAVSMLSIANKWRVRVVPKNTTRAGTLLIYKNPRKKLDIVIEETAGVP